jgi:hypothetical protein
MANLLVRNDVPFRSSHGEPGALLFCQWLPEHKDAAIIVPRPPYEVRVWLDRTCLRSRNEVTDDELSRWVNMPATKLIVEVAVESVDSELSGFIARNSDWGECQRTLESTNEETRKLAKAYSDVGWAVLNRVLDITNRIAAWAYAECKHYWLRERDRGVEVLMGRNAEFHATVSIDGGAPTRWCPPFIDIHDVGVIGGQRGLREKEWTALQSFLLSDRRPLLFRELLANALSLLDSGHTRSAVIEAVSALEVALRRFARSPDPIALTSSYAAERGALTRDLERLGFGVSVRYLLPVILKSFDASVVSHADSCEALENRNNIVHNGQRDVPLDTARRLVWGVSRFAEDLDKVTLRDGH